MPNLDFKSNYSDLQIPEPIDADFEADVELYAFPSNVRNVCFALSDGRRVFFNYAYLVSVELNFKVTPNILKVHFTSQTVLITGYKLLVLFDNFMLQTPQIIEPNILRYVEKEVAQTITNISLAE